MRWRKIKTGHFHECIKSILDRVLKGDMSKEDKVSPSFWQMVHCLSPFFINMPAFCLANDNVLSYLSHFGVFFMLGSLWWCEYVLRSSLNHNLYLTLYTVRHNLIAVPFKVKHLIPEFKVPQESNEGQTALLNKLPVQNTQAALKSTLAAGCFTQRRR